MAHDDERPGPVVDERGEPGARAAVEVVRRLVEQRDGAAPHPQAADRDEHRLAAGQLADAPVEADAVEPDLGERLGRSRLDVPVVADGVEVPLVDVAGLDRAQGVERAVDAEQARDARVEAERERLREVGDVAGGRHAPGRRREQAGDEAQQRGLAGAVVADEARAAGAERAGEVGERDGAVGPLEREVGQRHRGPVQGGHGCAPRPAVPRAWSCREGRAGRRRAGARTGRRWRERWGVVQARRGRGTSRARVAAEGSDGAERGEGCAGAGRRRLGG